MTSRERPSPDTGTPPLTRSAVAVSAMPALICPSSLWEQWFREASAPQRAQLLEQARQQGLLFAQQLPAPEGTEDSSPAHTVLTHLLAGKADSLAPVSLPSLSWCDAQLDESQRRAVACALGTPDLALILGYPGSGKTRVVLELLHQTLQRQLRVLLVAPDSPPLDLVLPRLAAQHRTSVLRLLSRQELQVGVPAWVEPLSLQGVLRSLQQETLPQARKVLDEKRQLLHQLQTAEQAYPSLEKLLHERQALLDHRHRLTEAASSLQARVAQLVESLPEWQHFLQDSTRQQVDLETRQQQLHQEAEQLIRKQADCEQQRVQLAPLAEAKQGHRWWTGAFWRATMHKDLLPQLEQLAQECQSVCEQLERIRLEQTSLQTQRTLLLSHRQQHHQHLLDQVYQSQRTEAEAQLAQVDAQLHDWNRRWLEIGQHLPLGEPDAKLPEPSLEALHAFQQANTDRRKSLQADLVPWTNWVQTLEEELAGLARELLLRARVLAAPLQTILSESLPGELATSSFDVIVVEDAHRLSEADLLALSKRGNKLVLFAEPDLDLPLAPPRKSDRARSGPPLPVLTKLWTLLHPDPRRLPTRCRQTQGRLVLQLRPLSPEQQQGLQREPVFDRPEIELGIVTPAGQAPFIAEVLFPGHTSIQDAKEFVYRELQILPVQAEGLAMLWRETDQGWTLDFSPPEEGEPLLHLVEPGVRERLRRCACASNTGVLHWLTHGFDFDRSLGWDRTRAERWIEELIGLRDQGRTAILSGCYRSHPDLVRVLSGVLYGGACHPASPSADATPLPSASPPVEFISVPSSLHPEMRRATEPEPRWNGGGTATLAPRTRSARGGAGFEMDLTESRRPDLLPPELRGLVPLRGLINHVEAQTVLQTLQEMLADPTLRSACLQFQSDRASAAGPAPVAIAVFSLFSAQVELLRNLIRRSEPLLRSGVSIEVCHPQSFAHRECLLGLISLTRSHLSRAVPFADHPRELALAMTRPVARLVLFGDPGTMSRRCQWFGALDHQDECSGPVEQALLGLLLARLPEQQNSSGGRARESSSV